MNQPNENTPPKSFESSLSELERIVSDLESGELPLAESLKQYEAGVAHLRKCYEQLEVAERRVELLKSVQADGTAETEPFADDSLTLEEKASSRARRRSTRS
ncbi:MAG: exodeoxyribonuclease VII small subunit [Planctomycetales bacterium]|nr:exodeoxyribonuclease VII small subunit [Planctomycetales bacterium]